jgi:hypothetical protein
MDRSFLSQPEVVQASRKFVCIRLATYESLQEAQVLRRLFVGGSGQVENTTFALLSPDGQHPLVRSGRSPQWSFARSGDMAQTMELIAAYYKGKPDGGALPTVANLRLALNVGACDNLPVVALLRDPSSAFGHEAALAAQAWRPDWIGRAIYCIDQPSAAQALVGQRLAPGLYVLQAGPFGLDGRVLAAIELDSPEWQGQLSRALDLYQVRPKDTHVHMREGNQRGVYWQTQIPVTDPHPRPRL